MSLASADMAKDSDTIARAGTSVSPNLRMPAVYLAGIRKTFGEKVALDGAGLDVAWGEVHALLGENGAGKSTLMNVLAGFYAADSGEAAIDGQPGGVNTPLAAVAAGIGMIHQHFKLVGPLTVIENIRLACARHCKWRSHAEAEAAMTAMAVQVGFNLSPHSRVDKLSVSDQQKLEILKVLLLGARILIMDEPTAVLTEAEATVMLSLARQLATGGRAVILITHKLRDVIGYSDRVTVMRGGKTVIAGAPTTSLTAVTLATAMVGEDTRVAGMRRLISLGPKLLELFDVGTVPAPQTIALHGVGLEVRGGEIFGVAGVGGNGQSELVELLIGLRQARVGEIWINGEKAPASPIDRRANGLRFIPSDRFHMGLFGDLPLKENIALARLSGNDPERRFWVSQGWMRQLAATAIAEFEVAGASPDTPVRLLSGGNAQKLLLAREFTGEFKVLVAHSPTRGLDIRAVAAVQARLVAAAARGVAVLLISEDLDEVLELSDRVAVMSHGKLSEAVPIAEVDRALVGRMMLGEA